MTKEVSDDHRRKKGPRDYTLSVVEQVEKGEMSYKQAKHRYGIQERSTILVWLRKHGRMDWLILSPTPHVRSRIKELEVQLKEANEKARLLEAMLDVVKNEYGLSILKRPSGRSSSKSKA